MVSRVVSWNKWVISRALSTSASETYSFVQSRVEYRKKIASLRKVFIEEENRRKERLARDAEAQRQKVLKAKATRLEIKRQQQDIRAKEVAREKAVQAEKVRIYFKEKDEVRQKQFAEVERRREALVASLRQHITKWTTADNYLEKLKEDVFIYSPHQISARGSFDPSSTSGSAISWLEKLQRMKPAGLIDSSDEVIVSAAASTSNDENFKKDVSSDEDDIMEALNSKKEEE